jgi:hypothetical protein
VNGISYTNKYLRKRHPEEWVALIKEFSPKMQVAVANIIWWDFFGDRITLDRWNHLDDYLSIPVDAGIPKDKIAKALVSLGYTEYQAAIRVR